MNNKIFQLILWRVYEKIISLGIFFCLSIYLAGCVTITPAKIKPVTMLEPRVPKSGGSKPMMFKKILVKLPRGKTIGSIQQGIFCLPQSSLTWQGGRALISDEEFGETLREELEKNGYTVVGDPDALFEDKSSWKAEFLIAGQITDMSANICYFMPPNSKGESYMEVEWQIYSRKVRDVVLKFKTEGNSNIETPSTTGDQEVFYQAFAMAVNNMLAKKDFYELVALDREIQKKNQGRIKRYYDSIQNNLRNK